MTNTTNLIAGDAYVLCHMPDPDTVPGTPSQLMFPLAEIFKQNLGENGVTCQKGTTQTSPKRRVVTFVPQQDVSKAVLEHVLNKTAEMLQNWKRGTPVDFFVAAATAVPEKCVAQDVKDKAIAAFTKAAAPAYDNGICPTPRRAF